MMLMMVLVIRVNIYFITLHVLSNVIFKTDNERGTSARGEYGLRELDLAEVVQKVRGAGLQCGSSHRVCTWKGAAASETGPVFIIQTDSSIVSKNI